MAKKRDLSFVRASIVQSRNHLNHLMDAATLKAWIRDVAKAWGAKHPFQKNTRRYTEVCHGTTRANGEEHMCVSYAWTQGYIMLEDFPSSHVREERDSLVRADECACAVSTGQGRARTGELCPGLQYLDACVHGDGKHALTTAESTVCAKCRKLHKELGNHHSAQSRESLVVRKHPQRRYDNKAWKKRGNEVFARAAEKIKRRHTRGTRPLQCVGCATVP